MDTHVCVRSVSCIILSVRQLTDEVRANSEPGSGYQEHHQVVNHEVGEVTFVAVAALRNRICHKICIQLLTILTLQMTTRPMRKIMVMIPPIMRYQGMMGCPGHPATLLCTF